MGNRAAYLTYQWNYGQTPRVRQSAAAGPAAAGRGGGFGGGMRVRVSEWVGEWVSVERPRDASACRGRSTSQAIARREFVSRGGRGAECASRGRAAAPARETELTQSARRRDLSARCETILAARELRVIGCASLPPIDRVEQSPRPLSSLCVLRVKPRRSVPTCRSLDSLRSLGMTRRRASRIPASPHPRIPSFPHSLIPQLRSFQLLHHDAADARAGPGAPRPSRRRHRARGSAGARARERAGTAARAGG